MDRQRRNEHLKMIVSSRRSILMILVLSWVDLYRLVGEVKVLEKKMSPVVELGSNPVALPPISANV